MDTDFNSSIELNYKCGSSIGIYCNGSIDSGTDCEDTNETLMERFNNIYSNKNRKNDFNKLKEFYERR